MKRHSPAEREPSQPRALPTAGRSSPSSTQPGCWIQRDPITPPQGSCHPSNPTQGEPSSPARAAPKAPATYDMRAPPAAASRSSPARTPPCSGQTPPAGNRAGRAVGGPGGRDGGGGRGGEPPVPQAAGRCSGPGDERGASARWGSRGGRALPGPSAG